MCPSFALAESVDLGRGSPRAHTCLDSWGLWPFQFALSVVGFTDADTAETYRILAVVLHLGNIVFGESESDAAKVVNPDGARGAAHPVRPVAEPRTLTALGGRPLSRTGGCQSSPTLLHCCTSHSRHSCAL